LFGHFPLTGYSSVKLTKRLQSQNAVRGNRSIDDLQSNVMAPSGITIHRIHENIRVQREPSTFHAEHLFGALGRPVSTPFAFEPVSGCVPALELRSVRSISERRSTWLQ